jgi:hypothetical protein
MVHLARAALVCTLLARIVAPAFAGGCKSAVCEDAGAAVTAEMRSRNLEAIAVAQDVSTGALVLFAASDPARFDVATEILPLSLSKLLLAASWWEHNDADSAGSNGIPELVWRGADLAGKQIAVQLRQSAGEKAVLADIRRFGFNDSTPFGDSLDSSWKTRLSPEPSHVLTEPSLDDDQWGSALSIGETHMTVSALHISRFLQAVGNRGVMCAPFAKNPAGRGPSSCQAPHAAMKPSTAGSS